MKCEYVALMGNGGAHTETCVTKKHTMTMGMVGWYCPKCYVYDNKTATYKRKK